MSPRTKAEFDQWYRASQGDPWGYDKSPLIHDRLRASLRLVEECLPEAFQGAFVEMGPFNGSFTRLLAAAYPGNAIFAFEISEVAAQQMSAALAQFTNVRVVNADILTMTASQVQGDSGPPALLAFEVLYYLGQDEQQACLVNLRAQFPQSPLFISGPTVGGKYFTEESLIEMCRAAGYRLVRHRALNLRRPVPLVASLVLALCQRSTMVRRRLANQVAYSFVVD